MITTKCKNINYNNVSQKRLTKFALIKYHINFQNYGKYFIRNIQTDMHTHQIYIYIFLPNYIHPLVNYVHPLVNYVHPLGNIRPYHHTTF